MRDAQGSRLSALGATDQRGEAWFWVFGPAWTDVPPAGWFRQALPRSAKVYPDHGRLWRTASLLRCYGIAWGALGAAEDCLHRARQYVPDRNQSAGPWRQTS